MISSAPGRWLRGIRRMNMRPVLPDTLWTLAPMAEKKFFKYGFFPTTSITAFCCRTMASKEMPWAASVKAKMVPWSSLGRNPLGITPNRARVRMRSRNETIMVARRRWSTHFRVRS